MIISVRKYLVVRVGIKPGFYHKAQPGGFYEGGFLGFYGFYVGFINLKVYLITPITPSASCYMYLTVFLCKQYWSKEKQSDQDYSCLYFCLHLLMVLLCGKVLSRLQKL